MPKPIVINGDVWRVVRVPAGDPRLVGRTGTHRLATTSQRERLICVRNDVEPPLLDKVLLHEIAHAITMSWDMLRPLHHKALRGDLTGLEEWSAQLVENHAIEALEAARMVLRRPACVRGRCL